MSKDFIIMKPVEEQFDINAPYSAPEIKEDITDVYKQVIDKVETTLDKKTKKPISEGAYAVNALLATTIILGSALTGDPIIFFIGVAVFIGGGIFLMMFSLVRMGKETEVEAINEKLSGLKQERAKRLSEWAHYYEPASEQARTDVAVLSKEVDTMAQYMSKVSEMGRVLSPFECESLRTHYCQEQGV